MRIVILYILIFVSTNTAGQVPHTKETIDNYSNSIDLDKSKTRKVYDTVSYEKEDGGKNWDSLYIHKEYYYKNGALVKIISSNKYVSWRSDIQVYYYNGVPVKFGRGEAEEGSDDYGKLNFDIYYYEDKAIATFWLKPKPGNVLGIATDVYIKWAYELFKEAK